MHRHGREIIHEAGEIFERLTVIERAGIHPKEGKTLWKCRCICGSIVIVLGCNLRNGTTTSCGCYRRDFHTKHGKANRGAQTAAYTSWCSMIGRCTNSKDPAYKNYGARGITVCREWRDFRKFFEDMGEPPTGLFLERKNNDLGYSKKNCKWATRTEQNRNTRQNRYLTHEGKTACIAEWASITGVAADTIRARKNYGWTDAQALSRVVNRGKKLKEKD